MKQFRGPVMLAGSLFVAATGVASAQQEAARPAVTAAVVSTRDVTPSTNHVGRVEAVDSVEVRARVEGTLAARDFEEGRLVRQGERLFLIEPEEYEIAVAQRQAEVAAAEAKLKNALSQLKRTEVLRRRNALAQADLESAEADADTARAEVARAKAVLRDAELNLSYTTIVSPVDGVAARSNYSVGSLVGPNGDPLTVITSVDPIYVTIRVSEKNLLRVRREGINLDSPKVEPFLILSDGEPYAEQGAFDYLDPTVDQSTDTVLARASFPNPKGVLIPGQFVRVQVRLKETVEAIAIPQSAVQEDSKGHFVLVVNQADEVEARRVRLGERYETDWVVLDGLATGERIIVQGLQKVRAGAKVTVKLDQ